MLTSADHPTSTPHKFKKSTYALTSKMNERTTVKKVDHVDIQSFSFFSLPNVYHL